VLFAKQGQESARAVFRMHTDIWEQTSVACRGVRASKQRAADAQPPRVALLAVKMQRGHHTAKEDAVWCGVKRRCPGGLAATGTILAHAAHHDSRQLRLRQPKHEKHKLNRSSGCALPRCVRWL
jgi:hypothetical protein